MVDPEHGIADSGAASLAEKLARLDAVTRDLTGPGGMFEVVEEDVGGERMAIFRDRPRSLREYVLRAADHGDADCYVFGDGTRVRFDELPGLVASAAAYLRDRHGVGPGDRVAICAANSPGWLLAFWATTCLGAVVVGMNGWWTATEMVSALELSDPTLLLIDAKRADRLDADRPGDGDGDGDERGSGDGDGVGRERVVPRLDLDEAFAAMVAHDPTAALPTVAIDEDDPATLIFTSGTTGRPKSATLTHRNIVGFTQMQLFIGVRSIMAGDAPAPAGRSVRLAVFPLFHISGLSGPVTGLVGGSTTVWPVGRFDPAEVIELTRREGITGWSGTITHISRLLDHPDLARLDRSTITQIGIGGSATTPELVRRVEALFPHLAGTMSSGYGSTETAGLVSYAPGWLLRAWPDCVGPPLPTVSVRITDDDGRPVPDGRVGEIRVRSPLVTPGYWQHAEADAQSFGPGRWYRTGDYGRLEDGLLFIASRVRDLIIRGGENVYPAEVEHVIEALPEVAECAVVGLDDRDLGQTVHAVVVVHPRASLDPEAVRRRCATTLAAYKVPATVALTEDPLPRNPTGKVLKQVLVGGELAFVDD